MGGTKGSGDDVGVAGDEGEAGVDVINAVDAGVGTELGVNGPEVVVGFGSED